MPSNQVALSGYRPVWLFAMFDLPVKTAADRKRYARFRKLLLNDGFSMMQYSVYARYCASEETAAVHRQLVRDGLPDEGQVRLLAVTDRQFGKMENYIGKRRKRTEDPPRQLMLF
ncbi:MAG: CRISPR-associated endoribonuclease Cas2 [Phycisphaerae bacterium]|nr:CRISPR-associated endoribonuclease Cas2 [Phycisphaerae bacterium]